MLEAPHFSPAGARRDGGFALPEEYFDGTVHRPVLHQAVRAYLNNQRQGTAATKTRSEVSGGNQKPWKQKGTGRARQGSIRAPHWRGGGTVFGPQPRSYRTDLPKKVRQLARRSALNARAGEGGLFVVERLRFDAPRTALLLELLRRLEIADRKVLVLTRGTSEAVYLSGRNLSRVKVMDYQEASAYDVLWSEVVVVEQAALTGEEPTVADEAALEVTKAPPRAKAAPKAPAKARAKAKAATPAAKKAVKKKATKKATKKKAAPRKATATAAKKKKSTTAKKKTTRKKGSK
jgi:large subunit ribosomal protein L4